MYGESGTGKTVMLIEVLKLKVGQLKLEKKPFKVIFANYDELHINSKMESSTGPRLTGIGILTMQSLKKGDH